MATDPVQALRTHLAVTGDLRAEVGRLRALLDAKAQECCTADCCTEREMAQAYSRDLAAEVERLRAMNARLADAIRIHLEACEELTAVYTIEDHLREHDALEARHG